MTKGFKLLGSIERYIPCVVAALIFMGASRTEDPADALACSGMMYLLAYFYFLFQTYSLLVLVAGFFCLALEVGMGMAAVLTVLVLILVLLHKAWNCAQTIMLDQFKTNARETIIGMQLMGIFLCAVALQVVSEGATWLEIFFYALQLAITTTYAASYGVAVFEAPSTVLPGFGLMVALMLALSLLQAFLDLATVYPNPILISAGFTTGFVLKCIEGHVERKSRRVQKI